MRKCDLSNRLEWIKFCEACLQAGFDSALNDADNNCDGEKLCEQFVLGTFTGMHKTHAERLFGIGYSQGFATVKGIV